MSDYLFLTNIGDDFINSISISKFVPNRRIKTKEYIEFKVVIYTQKKDALIWCKLDEVYFNDANNITLNSNDYDLDVGQLAVVVPCLLDFICEDIIMSLPEPISRKLDSSPVNERATISFSRGELSSSYQGEFPFAMSRVKGTFLAFDALIGEPHKKVSSKIVFINIFSKELPVKNTFSFNVANSSNKEIIKTYEYVHNSALIVDVDNMSDLSYVFYSKDTLGIPIFITYGEGEEFNLSVEHTHPPSELFWGDDKFYGQSLLKSKWMNTLP